MKRRLGKFGSVFLVLALALGLTGAGFAHWSQTLYVEGDVDTGSFNVGWTELTCVEKHRDPITGFKVDGEYLGKDVGSVEGHWEILKEDPITGKRGYEKILVTIDNAYPCYQVHVIVAVENLGTVPAHFTEILVTGRDETDGEDLGFEWLSGFQYEKGFFWDDYDADGVYDPDEEIINLEVVNFVCNQLDPCHNTKGEFDFHFKQEIEQGHTYTFEVQLVAVQWNKA